MASVQADKTPTVEDIIAYCEKAIALCDSEIPIAEKCGAWSVYHDFRLERHTLLRVVHYCRGQQLDEEE